MQCDHGAGRRQGNGRIVNDRKIRHEARDVNRQLGLGARADLNNIKSWLEAERGRPITIMELPTLRGNDLCGIFVSYEHLDVVAHATLRSTWHQQQISLHEFAHLIVTHQLTAISLDLAQFPGFPETPLKVLGRTSFDDEAEAAAEYIADLLTARIRPPPIQDPQDDQSGINKVFE